MSVGCVVLAKLGVFQPIEYSIYNYLYHLRGERSWDSRVVVVAIDDASIQGLGRFPWSRQHYIDLFNVLAPSQPSVIGMNLVFSEPSAEDTKLATAMLDFGRVVLAQATTNTGELLNPTPALKDAAIATGHILHHADSDGVTRKVSLRFGNSSIFGLAVIQAYSLVHEEVPIPPVEEPFWLNWTGRSHSLTQYSFIDVVQNRVSPQAFHNKIVLVGVTATGIDTLITPYDRNPPANGIVLQANLVNNLLQQSSLIPLKAEQEWLLALLIGTGLGLIFSRGTGLSRLCIWLTISSVWIGAGIVLFHAGYWLPIALPLGLITASAMATTIVQQLQLNLQIKQQVQELWTLYHQDLVVHQSANSTFLKDKDWIEFNGMHSLTQLTDLANQFGRSQSTQSAIARNLSTGLLAADMDGRVWFCNPVMTDYLGIQVGNYVNDILIGEWLSQEQWQWAFQALTNSKESFFHVFQKGDRWFALKLEPLIYSSHPPHQRKAISIIDGLLLVLEDITVQKQAEMTLAHQVQELKRLSQLKDDFLSTVSHELRSPMANIQMAIKLLEVSKSPERTAHYLKILQTECTREIELINDLLDLQRLEADAQVFHKEDIHLQDWLPPIVEPFYERAESQQQTIEIEIDHQLPVLASDSSSLHRVVTELVNNACKYTPADGVIKVSAHAYSSHVELAVSNSGSEIPAADLPRIFEKFYRVPQSDQWKRGGTGLGLALVQKLIQCLGGSIQVRSEAGQTTFTVKLPVSTHFQSSHPS